MCCPLERLNAIIESLLGRNLWVCVVVLHLRPHQSVILGEYNHHRNWFHESKSKCESHSYKADTLWCSWARRRNCSCPASITRPPAAGVFMQSLTVGFRPGGLSREHLPYGMESILECQAFFALLKNKFTYNIESGYVCWLETNRVVQNKTWIFFGGDFLVNICFSRFVVRNFLP